MVRFFVFDCCCIPKTSTDYTSGNELLMKKKGVIVPEASVAAEKRAQTPQQSSPAKDVSNVSITSSQAQKEVNRPGVSALSAKVSESKTDYDEPQTPGPEPEGPKNFKRDRRTGVSAEAGNMTDVAVCV